VTSVFLVNLVDSNRKFILHFMMCCFVLYLACVLELDELFHAWAGFISAVAAGPFLLGSGRSRIFPVAVRLPARSGLAVRSGFHAERFSLRSEPVRSLDFVTAGFQFWVVGSVRHLLKFAISTPRLGLLSSDRFFTQGPRHQQRFSLVLFSIRVADPPPAGLCFCRLIYLACGADLV
jgi:hypothetical protein